MSDTGLRAIRIQALGGLAVFEGGRPLGGNAQQPRRLAVLAVLARAGDRGVSRDRLAALLWEDADEDRARRSLNQALYALRHDLGSEDAILGTRDLRLNPEIVEVDLTQFETATACGAFEEAARLYTGPFLGDFHLAGVPAFARWADEERAGLAAEYRRILEAVAGAAGKRDDRSAAVLWWRRLAALDPADAGATQGLMRALVAAGDVPGAIRQAEIFDQIRQQELELPADPAVQALAQRIREGAYAPEPAPNAPKPVPVRTVEAAEPSASPAVATSSAPAPPRRPPAGPRALAAAVLIGLGVILAWWGTYRERDVAGPKRLAVLPFENEGDSADAYFTDGITDQLRGKLTTIPGLEVVASVSSSNYRGSTIHLAEIARELGVSYLLIGKVRS
ncbi:MAG TPA: BTAD domain-containing putative transcriptional regulator, partial [Gemmatimonadales bacterium]|nr:BTAD domain-containing putative transcriptional regulator [Gemmatimonadales bacterium]